jgi:hypothetical protein
MAKTYAKLVFFGAMLLGLFHGCSDASTRCLGHPSACEGRSQSQCIEGCSLRTGCLGDPIVCEQITEDALCQQTPGCELLANCDGVPDDDGAPACNTLQAAQCRQTPGCQYNVSCTGGVTSCEDLDSDTCGLYPQCGIQTRCVGRADSCADVTNIEQCSAVPGCYPADTDPAIVP